MKLDSAHSVSSFVHPLPEEKEIESDIEFIDPMLRVAEMQIKVIEEREEY